MGLNFVFLTILFLLIFVSAVYFLYSKNFRAVKGDRRVKLPNEQSLDESLDINLREHGDLVDKMFFLADSLGEDGANSGNYVLFDYSMNYPRFFYANQARIIKLTDALAQILLLNLSDSTIVIKFLLSSYNKNQVKFIICAQSNKKFGADYEAQNIVIAMSKQSRKFLNLAKALAHENDSEIKFDFDPSGGLKISTQVTLELSHAKNDILKELKDKNFRRFTALVAESDPHSFGIITRELELVGMDVKPTADIEIIKRHVNDFIFRPDIVFVRQDLIDSDDIAQIKQAMIDKNIALVIIKNGGRELKIEPEIYVQYLSQPHTYDSLVAILNNFYEYQKSR